MPAARAFLYVSTIGAFALVARGLVMGPIPITWAAGATLAYALVIAVGVIFLRLGMFLDVVWRGPGEARGVALTFDDGPSPASTPKVLDILDRAGAKATFFVIGKKAEAHPDLVKDIAARGHTIGLHSYAHDRLFSIRSPKFIRADLEREIALIEKLVGVRPLLFRPPIGHSSPRVARVVDALDLIVVGWGVRAMDGLGRADPDKLVRRVRLGLKDGAIVQLHDAAERDDFEPASVRALPHILDAMDQRDLEAVRVDDWL